MPISIQEEYHHRCILDLFLVTIILKTLNVLESSPITSQVSMVGLSTTFCLERFLSIDSTSIDENATFLIIIICQYLYKKTVEKDLDSCQIISKADFFQLLDSSIFLVKSQTFVLPEHKSVYCYLDYVSPTVRLVINLETVNNLRERQMRLCIKAIHESMLSNNRKTLAFYFSTDVNYTNKEIDERISIDFRTKRTSNKGEIPSKVNHHS
ncbi:hypothetical protein BY458DRAFT_544740 [Sporodiniella umbellata]|nr:hypothetical protein BY458DRAFT_544740 [Sporodiniella umbellata]